MSYIRRYEKSILYGFVLILTLILGGIQWRLYNARFTPIEEPLVIGKSMGNLSQVSFPSHLGHRLTLANMSNEGLVVIFLHTKCDFCRLDAPLWKILDQETVVVGVTEEVDIDMIKTYAETNDFDFPIIVDSEGALFDFFDVSGTPTKFALSEDLVVLQRWLGLTTLESPQSEIGSLYSMFGIHPSYLPDSALPTGRWFNLMSPR